MATTSTQSGTSTIKAIDKTSIHRITSGQVVIDLQTAVKELVENSLDAGATSIEVRFKQYGVASVEVVDNGCGVAEEDWESIGLKHYTSKIAKFEDLATVQTFGFRGEALSSLSALCESVVVTTSTKPPMGIQLELEKSGRVGKQTKIARPRGTTVTLTNLFAPLPVRRKELERNAKREFSKALHLLNGYALGPCAGMDKSAKGVRLTVSNQVEKGQKTIQIRTQGTPSFRASMTALWGPKVMDSIVDLDLNFVIHREKASLKRIRDSYADSGLDNNDNEGDSNIPIQVKGLISKFSMGCGRTGTDRQFFYVNGRPCNLTKVQKAFNEVYRSFNVNQAPFLLANFIVPTDCCDVNVSPDKRTIFLQSEGNLVDALKNALEDAFSPNRSRFDVNSPPVSQPQVVQKTLDDTFSKEANVTITNNTGRLLSLQSRTESIPDRENNEKKGERSLHCGRVPGVSSEVETSSPDKTPNAIQLSEASVSSATTLFLPDEDEEDEVVNARPSLTVAAKAKSTGFDNMDVDEHNVNEEGEVGHMVVDTTKAAWCHSAGLTQQNGQLERRVEKNADDREPASKKRRIVMDIDSEVEEVSMPDVKSVSVVKVDKPKKNVTPLGNLRTQLANFVRPGSQLLSSTSLKVAVSVDGDRDQEMEDISDEESDVGRQKQNSRNLDEPGAGPLEFQTIGPKDVPTGGVTEDASCIVSNPATLAVNQVAVLEDNGRYGRHVHYGHSPSSTTESDVIRRAEEVIRREDTQSGSVTFKFNLPRIVSIWKQRQEKSCQVTRSNCRSSGETLVAGGVARKGGGSTVSADAGISNIENNETAAQALSRVIEKIDFGNMEVLGQFNLGFIIVRRRKPGSTLGMEEAQTMDDLFIIDQHAADEKYNFETLQQTTKIQSQRLFKPQPLELTAADELVAIENVDALRQNGFELEATREEDGCNSEFGQVARLRLVAQPVSKSTTFDMKDLEELIHLLRERSPGEVVRCSKVRAMFAMRACRKSVMIGMALTKNQMSTLVEHMGLIDQPWNCPHGRPTMRHLYDLCLGNLQETLQPINFASFDAPEED